MKPNSTIKTNLKNELAAANGVMHTPVRGWHGLLYFASSTPDGRATQFSHPCPVLHATVSVLRRSESDKATATLFIQ